MIQKELSRTIDEVVVRGKGILAADESTSTIGKRFADIHVENTEEHRRQYRSLLLTTPQLNEYISGVILYEETLHQETVASQKVSTTLVTHNIVPGIKVDQGLIPFDPSPEEKVTQGLETLGERLPKYKDAGARFAKWRNVYVVNDTLPTAKAIATNAQILAYYAKICQDLGIVPIVEPEVLMDGNHSIERAKEVTDAVLKAVFSALKQETVELEYIILKPNMVIPGKNCSIQAVPEEVAEYTLAVLDKNVPAAVPSINFLSGGQTPMEATLNLNAINSLGAQPWYLSFSYGRALQEPCLSAWGGNPENINRAQQALYHRAKLNSLAAMGQYKPEME